MHVDAGVNLQKHVGCSV